MNTLEVTVSKHAAERIKERPGKKLKPERFAKMAVERGLAHGELKGNLRRWVDSMVLPYRKKSRPYIYNGHLCVFSRDLHLITVIPVPGNLNALTARLIQQKKVVR